MTEPKDQSADAPQKPREGRSRWKIFFWISGIVAALVVVFIIATPFVIRWALEKALAQQGAIHARVQDVDFNPFYGKLVIEAFRGFPDADEAKLAVAQAVINVNWLPLWEKRIFLSDLVLRDVELRVERHPDGEWTLGDLKIPTSQDQELSAQETGEQDEGQWAFGVGRILIENVVISYQDPQLNIKTKINRAQAGRLATWEPEQSTPFNLSLNLRSGTLEMEGEAKPFSTHPSGHGTLVIDQIPVGWFQPALAEQKVQELAGLISSDLNIEAAEGQNEDLTITTEGNLDLASANLQHTTASIQEGRINWQGQTFLRLPSGGAGPEWSLEGDARISAEDLQWSTEEDALSAGGAFDTNQHIRAARAPHGVLEADLKGQLKVRGGHFENPDLVMEQTELSWGGTLSIAQQPDTSLGIEAAGTLGSKDLRLTLKAPGLALREQELDIEMDVAWAGNEPPATGLKAQVNISSGALQVEDLERQLEMLQVSSFIFESFEAAGLNQLSVERVVLNQVAALERADKIIPESPDHILRAEEVQLEGLALENFEELAAQAVFLKNMNAWLQREKDETLEISRWFADGKEEDPPPKAKDEEESTALHVALQEFSVNGESTISYIDYSVSPEVKENISQLSLSVSDLDMAHPDQAAMVTGEGQIGDNGLLTLEGTIRPFLEEISTDLVAKLQNLNLSPLDGYVRNAVGYRLKSGRLSGEIIGKIETGNLDSQLDLLIEKLEIDPLGEQLKTETTANLGVPLGSALNLLREKEGDIHLEVPIEGDLSDPQFQLGKVIQSAIFKALKTGVVSYYAPLGVSLLTGASLPAGALWAAGKLFDMATALRFDPVIFEPGASQLTSEQSKRVEEMATLLSDRPEVDLVVCGIATPKDLQAIRDTDQSPEAGKQNDQDQVEGQRQTEGAPPAPTDQEQQAMYNLAAERMDAVRNALLEQGVSAARIVTCSPDYQWQAEAQPRVELGI